ncbi:hypothetical protein [Nakamurella lactea]|uniref:hypothetical protein n=1 Tax=Nakamurella lactea TaxID=459515 RepID=UPI00055DB9AD|nr:hypothetical protein [Nakamurella lactea]
MSEHCAQTDHLDYRRAAALAGLLDRPAPAVGDPLPPLWHLIYFLPLAAQSELGPDGHPRQGLPSPPRAGMRRLFAGGRITFAGALMVGDDAEARTDVIRSVDKDTRSGGRIRFVTSRTEIRVDDRVILTEERDIAYLEPATPSTPAPTPTGQSVGTDTAIEHLRAEALQHRSIAVDPTLLFRFSALTYNAHRIHYDLSYAREVEGHRGLVVHGPLQALLMAELAEAVRGPMTGHTFGYRLASPLYLGEGLTVLARSPEQLCIADDKGHITATAEIISI